VLNLFTEVKKLLDANDYILPTHGTDLLGATAAIFRLQDTYQITAKEVANGKIKSTSSFFTSRVYLNK